MSFPDYLNRIIYSQLKNKEIETVRAEITKLITTNKKKKENDASQASELTLKMQEIPKTISNFFNVHSIYKQKEQKLEPRKTFSEMHINRLKKRLTLEEQNRNLMEVPEPEQANMNEWRSQMLKHLKSPLKKPLFQPKIEVPLKEVLKSYEQKETPQQKRKFNFSKTAASSPVLKKFQRRQKIRRQANEDNFHISSQKNIILIRPHPITEEQAEQKTIPKLRKTTIKQKRPSRRSESQQNEFTVQRLANFTALLPFLGAQRAKVQNRQDKKFKIPDEVNVIVERNDNGYKRKNKIPEQIIEITGWDIEQD